MNYSRIKALKEMLEHEVVIICEKYSTTPLMIDCQTMEDADYQLMLSLDASIEFYKELLAA